MNIRNCRLILAMLKEDTLFAVKRNDRFRYLYITTLKRTFLAILHSMCDNEASIESRVDALDVLYRGGRILT